MKAGGFTLLEMLVAAAILAILVGTAIPLLGGMQERSRAAACLGNLRALGVALQLHAAEHNGCMPDIPATRDSINSPEPGIDTVLISYLDDPRVLACPSDNTLAAATGTSYFFNSALRGQPLAGLNFLGVANAPSRIPVLVDKEGWHRGGSSRVNHLYADGSAGETFRLFAE